MKLTEELIKHIEDLEGFKTKAYRDENNVLTIGFGHTNATGTFDFDKDTEINREQALKILQDDLSDAENYVERMLANRDLSVSKEKKDFMTLVYFNRPWALRETMEVIAEGNMDLVIKSQLDSYKKNREEDIPDWYVNRINKEAAFAKEFDDPEETGGDAMPEKTPETGRANTEMPEQLSTLINRDGQETFVPTEIVEDLLKTGKYTETPGSVQEGQKEKEVKDVLTAHIYSYIQSQKSVYESQVPKEAGSIEGARIKTELERK